MSKLPPMDANDRCKYSTEEWNELARKWAEQEPDLKSAVEKLREHFPDAKVTYIGPRRQ